MAKTLEDYIDDITERGTKEDAIKLLKHQSFLLNAGKDINAASNDIRDIVSTAAISLGDHYNAASYVGLCYDESTQNFLYSDHHGVVPEKFLDQVKNILKENFLTGVTNCGPLGENYELEILTIPITGKDQDERPDYAKDGKYGVIQLARERKPFDKEFDKLMLTEFARDLMLAVNDNHALGLDEVTKGYNIKKFYEDLNYEKRKAEKHNDYTFSVVMFDLDHFKEVNDKYGSHDQGDSVLREYAELMRSNLRMADTFARVGGEEFAVLLPGMGLQDARTVGESLRKKVERYDFREIEGTGTLKVTNSAGVAEYDRESPNIRGHADTLLYEAKDNGRNRVYPLNSEGLNKK